MAALELYVGRARLSQSPFLFAAVRRSLASGSTCGKSREGLIRLPGETNLFYPYSSLKTCLKKIFKTYLGYIRGCSYELG